MKRSLSPIALLFASISAILGSGWLFSAFYTSKIAGPSAIFAWLIGGFIVIVIAFVFAELSAMLPITGSSSRIPQFTHGTLVSFLFSWMIWLSYAALAPTEVQALLQYISFYIPSLTHATGGLTKTGYMMAIGLMLIISTINIFSLRWLIRANNILTAAKIFIPVFISLIILLLFIKPHHASTLAHTTFMPFGMHGVLSAIASGGIVFAFNGFKQACEMAGDAKRPSRSLPIAILGSIFICLIIYLLLQVAFVGSVTLTNLKQGWHHLALHGKTSPFAAIIYQDHLLWLQPLLYLGAIIGPLAAALMYANSSSRSLYGTSKNGYLPNFLQRVTTQGSPIAAIITNFLLGILFFAPLPGWGNMVTFLASLIAITYAIGPVSLLALRKQAPHQHRPFKLPLPHLWATIAFYFCTLLIYWSGWHIFQKFIIATLLGFVFLLGYHFFTERGRKLKLHWRASTWIWLYFGGLTLISYLGNFGGGLNIIPFGWDFLVIGLFSIAIMSIATQYRLRAVQTQQYIKELNLELTHGTR